MKFHRAARCYQGWHASFRTNSGFILFIFRPLYWRLATLKLTARPGVTRRYVGPVEIESHTVTLPEAAHGESK